ncbi:MAG: Fur family transcriptional regulator [Rhizobiaceae bacterium]
MDQPLKLTKNQSLVLGELQSSDSPLSAYTLLDKLRPHGFRAALQVYRALEKLTESGLVHRLESINAFMACSHHHDHAHAHGVAAFAICETCGQVNEFADEVISERLSSWAKAKGFHADKTGIELRGQCSACTKQ